MPVIVARDITGVVLAGGRGQRLGGADKGLVPLAGKPLVEHVLDALRPQVGALMISANRNRETYAAYGFPVVADVVGDYDGPLAGILSAMRAAQTSYLACVPCDAPVLPRDLVARLAGVFDAGTQASVVTVAGERQPVFVLLRCALADDLQAYLESGERGAGKWLSRQHAAPVDFSDRAEAFANLNTPEDLRRLEIGLVRG